MRLGLAAWSPGPERLPLHWRYGGRSTPGSELITDLCLASPSGCRATCSSPGPNLVHWSCSEQPQCCGSQTLLLYFTFFCPLHAFLPTSLFFVSLSVVVIGQTQAHSYTPGGPTSLYRTGFSDYVITAIQSRLRQHPMTYETTSTQLVLTWPQVSCPSWSFFHDSSP